MSRVVPSSTQKSAAEKMITAVGRIKGCDAELVERSSGTRSRWTVSIVQKGFELCSSDLCVIQKIGEA